MTGSRGAAWTTGVALEREELRLPAVPGIADSIGPPVLTRGRAVARQGVTPEQYLFGGLACHKKRQDAGTRGARQPIYSRTRRVSRAWCVGNHESMTVG